MFKLKLKAFILITIMVFSFGFLNPKPASAMVVSDIMTGILTGLEKVWRGLEKAYEKSGSAIFQKTLSNALNKIAIDSATWIASGNTGQTPLVNLKEFGSYLGDIADEAAGEFIERSVNAWSQAYVDNANADLLGCTDALMNCNKQCATSHGISLNLLEVDKCISNCPPDDFWCPVDCEITNSLKGVAISEQAEACFGSCNQDELKCRQSISKSLAPGQAIMRQINICQPATPMGFQVKMQISLGLVNHIRPRAPNCTASDMLRSWYEAGKRIDFTNFDDRQWSQNLTRIFHPTNNELGMAMIMSSDMFDIMDKKTDIAKINIAEDGRWLGVKNADGNYQTTAERTQRQQELAEGLLQDNIGKITGDVFIDAANVFLNTLALQSYQRAMQNLPKLFSGGDDKAGGGVVDPDLDPNVGPLKAQYGEGASLRERISRIISPQYSSLDDYNVLSRFAVCPDPNNPGPTDCVIDESFVQAVMSRKTVIQAIKDGDLKAAWTFSSDSRNSSAYQLRSLMILRQNRILPVTWEIAAKKIEAEKKQATIMDLVSCFSGDDEYNTFSQGFNTNNVAWCRGLIDPHWVLKAPLSYCRKQGVGSHILNKTIMPGQPAIGSTPAVPSSLQIERDDNYCADYQSCIKESADGSCLFYGYCNEEKRIWTFGQASCDPVYNTCQSFSAPGGSRVNYLTNTLDFSCSEGDVGCLAYLLRGEFAGSRVNWDEDFVYHFDNDMTNCSSVAEGCTELIRVKPGWGANLNKLSDLSVYEDGEDLTALDYWQINATGTSTNGVAEIIEFNNEKVINFEAAGNATSSIGILSNFTKPTTPGATPVISGYSYTLSAEVYLRNNKTKAQVVLADWPYSASIEETADNNVVNSWQKISATYYIDENRAKTINHIDFRVQGVGLDVNSEVKLYIKNIKLELGSWDTGASLYGANKTYQKLIPPYLANACYIDAFSGSKDYRLKADAPAICSNFTRQCNKEEVGCELFTNNNDNFSVAAKVATTDYCWGDCVGYDMYIAQASQFHSPSAESIIPNNSTGCQSSEVGCTEFTNLETIARGGEAREYFSQLRRCVKPSATCDDFYTWQGSDESGYQLRTMLLEKVNVASTTPKLIDDSDMSCTETIYFKSPADPEYNPDCRQIYNKSGEVSYVSLFNTIVCSADCQTYRMSEKNIDNTLNTLDLCNIEEGTWDTSLSICYLCKNGGTWNTEQNACTYEGLPSESVSCSANANGCREYSGKLGSNVRLISAFDFKDGLGSFTTGPCQGGTNAHIPSLSQSSTSNNGNSLMYNISSTQACVGGGGGAAWLPIKKALATNIDDNGIKLPLGYNLRNDRSYSLRILAKANGDDVDALFSLESSTSTQTFFTPNPLEIKDDGQWHVYDLFLPALEDEVDENMALVIRADNSFFIDSLILNEVSDKYYLIRNSSYIPDICYYDVLDTYRGADYNLGCSAWTGRQNTTHYLRRFSSLCNESSIGCELMINTHNYSNWQAEDFEVNDDVVISVLADSFIYAVYNPNYACSASNKGCARVAQIEGQGINRSLTEVFKNNNPDNYNNSLCAAEAVGCQQFSSGAGVYYFKDPGFNTCVYRHPNDLEDLSGRNWYKTEVKRCDLNNDNIISGAEVFGRVCLSDNDCSLGICIADKNDYPCSVSYLKTIGLGDRVATPDMEVALCETRSVGCTEYIDPSSQHVSNLVFNPGFLNNNEGWVNGKQTINILPNTLYQFTADAAGPTSSLVFSVDLLQSNNSFITTSTPLVISEPEEVIIFNSRRNTFIEIDSQEDDVFITLKPIILDYQLKQNLDTSSCNGIVNTENGCVLFNERSVSGSNYNPFTYNPFDTEVNKSPSNCEAENTNCFANTLIKVQPDRTCARWLDCLTYVDDPETGERICYDLGECTSLDEYGNCSNFISFIDKSDNPILSNTDFSFNANTSGYSSLNRYYIGEMEEVGLNTELHFNFEGNSIALHCLNKDPVGACTFDNNIVLDSIIDSPDKAEVEYPAEGKKYLKVPANKEMYPHSESVSYYFETAHTYYLHYLLNTSKSGVDARVEILNQDNRSNTVVLSASANSGWERIIHRFKVPANGNYQIVFTSDSSEASFYYVDDIHIEPVLRVGPDEYVAKDCRLFPETNSFSCRSSSDNVIKNGLEGYCLERDPNNKNTCLMWYPVDQISSSQLYGGTTFGYTGKAPLYYCTEANANFELMKKIKPVLFSTFKHNANNDTTTINDDIWDEVDWLQKCIIFDAQYVCGGADTNYSYFPVVDTAGESQGRDGLSNLYCVPSVQKLAEREPKFATPVELPNSFGNCNGLTFTAKDIEDERLYIAYWDNGDKVYKVKSPEDSIAFLNTHFNLNDRPYASRPFYEYWTPESLELSTWSDRQYALAKREGQSMCPECQSINEFNNYDPPIAVYDKDNPPRSEEFLKFISHSEPEKVYNLTCNSFIELVDPYGVNKAWVQRLSNLSEAYITSDFMTKQIELSPFYILGSLGTCNFKDTIQDCSLFLLEDPEPLGCDESSKPDYCQTVGRNCLLIVDYCYDNDNETDCNDDASCQWEINTIARSVFDRYGRSREDVPFGAAVLPDNFNFYSSPLIPFRNQYSKKNNQEEILAGRPYGCAGDSCENIGQCSLDPNVFCIYDSYIGNDVNKQARANLINSSSCAKGNYGVCTPLWWGGFDRLSTTETPGFFQWPLKSLFLHSYQGFEYKEIIRNYDQTTAIKFKNSQASSDLTKDNDMEPCLNNPRGKDEWCAIYPHISNVKLNGNELTSPYTINTAGIYKLSFNTKVDPEQQPLNRIEIDWGDGNYQIISNQDHRPIDNRPHQVYHYYNSGTVEIKIKIYDNWGFFTLFPLIP